MDELGIRALLLNKGQGIPSLPWRDWEGSPLALRHYRWHARIELGPGMLGKKSLGLKHHQFVVRDGTSLPISRLGARGARGGAASTGHGGMDLCRVRSDEDSAREDDVIWI